MLTARVVSIGPKIIFIRKPHVDLTCKVNAFQFKNISLPSFLAGCGTASMAVLTGCEASQTLYVKSHLSLGCFSGLCDIFF